MARVTVEDCLNNDKNRFQLVMLATKRARQLSVEGALPLVDTNNDKPTVLALREISENLINEEMLEAQALANEAEAAVSAIISE